MLAAVITEPKDIPKAEGADLVELRLDYIKGLNDRKLKSIIKNSNKPVIATCRKEDEGGLLRRNEKHRINMLKNAAGFGAKYIDIEYSSSKNAIKGLIRNKKNAKIIISYHNFRETPANIGNVYINIKKLNPDLIKIVTNADSVADNFRIFDLIRRANKEDEKIIAFCMGNYGKFSRILSVILGAQIAYASVGKKSAIGQLTLGESIKHYRIKKLNKNTKIAGLIGNPVEHSWSHIMHNAAFDRLNINAVYLKFQVDRLKEFIGYFRKLNVFGFSVTIPHKVEVMKYLDEVDKHAREIGAVNTIVAKDGRLIGYNTDCAAAIRALKQKTRLEGRSAVVLGAGGAARAIAYGLVANGSDVTILNRDIGKAKMLAGCFKCSYGSLNDIKNIDYNILINATPAGMHPKVDVSPVPKNLIKRNSVIFDIVFNPFRTRLLAEAEKRNCAIITGFEMLVHGALMQFRLWTGKDAPARVMRDSVSNYLKNDSH